jgi:hypothetical protein
MSTDLKAALGKLNDAAIRSVLSYLNENYRSQISFIQFGANDGKRGDPINAFAKRHSWSGLVVEPVPEYFSRGCPRCLRHLGWRDAAKAFKAHT